MDKKIQLLLESSQKIALFWHRNPDGDCIWSLLGFGALLEKMGKKVTYFTPTLPSRIYDFLPWIKKISSQFDYGKYDLLVFLDFSDMIRIQEFYDKDPWYFDHRQVIVIDHHVYTGKNSNRYVISDDTAMSACELIFEHTYAIWKNFYDSKVATYLYLWLTTDSGNFRYDEDHKRILTNALELVNLGADKKMVVNNAFRRKSFAWVKMMECMFKRLQKKWWLIYTRYTDSDLKKMGIDREEADFWQIIIQDIDEAKVTAIFRTDEEKQLCCISLRSKYIDVQKIAKSFGGGGHIHAAWCTVPRIWRFQHQVEEISTKVAEMI
jgi:bifunctional oligoribonuclease and PAP phosphatase NrnA